MKWKKAGRPRKNKIVPEEIESKYTKQELTVYNDPVCAIACAVVKQWQEDGSPEEDIVGILPWLSIIKDKLC